MTREEFKHFILSIGFKSIGNYYYDYKEYEIYLYNNYYHFYNGSKWFEYYDLNDLSPLKKFTRSIKLKELLR